MGFSIDVYDQVLCTVGWFTVARLRQALNLPPGRADDGYAKRIKRTLEVLETKGKLVKKTDLYEGEGSGSRRQNFWRKTRGV